MVLTKWLLFAGHERKTYSILNKQLAKTNRIRLIAFNILFTVACIAMFVSSFFIDGLEKMRIAYLAFFVIGLAIFFVAFFLAKKHKVVTNILIYVSIVTTLLFGMFISSFLSPLEISATYIALLLTVPQLFIDKPYRIYLVTLIMNVLFILMVIYTKDQSTWRSDIINALVFYVVGAFLLTFNINTILTRYFAEKKANDLAETDQLTGLLNRNSYEHFLNSEDLDKSDNVYCVYIDANGLHDLNNKKGHEEGDRMLTFIAKAIQHTFAGQPVYRIGGDEFVAIVYDYSAADIVNHISSLRNQIDVAGYHAAIGYFNKKTTKTNLKNAIREAESNMYKDKRAYYDEEGKKPRRMHM